MKNTFKIIRNIAITGMVAAVAVMGFAGCSKVSGKYPPRMKREITVDDKALIPCPDKILGGWNASKDTTVTDDLEKIFRKATDGLTGAEYEPVEYLGSQVVSGLNHCFLTKVTAVYPGAVPHYSCVYIYESLDGTCQVTGVEDLDVAEG